jgi:arsenite methyltransferase
MTDEKITIEVANDLLRVNIRENYSQVANASNEGACCGVEASCCGVSDDQAINQLISTRLGYTVEELAAVPEGADMGLGCGNPKVIAALQKGEVVIDLGSGGGFDCFLAANEVGESGKVIGVDMTPDMLSKARANAERGRYAQVEFRLGEIENLPVADNTADVVMSNCVINLSPHKPRVFEEIFRVLKPGGRIAVSDVVATQPLPDEMKNDPFLISACVGGAALIDDLEQWMQAAGFSQVVIEPKDESKEFIRDWAPNLSIEDYVVSAAIKAVKP